MTYTALARRYRSRQFDEVVGQEAIARTLRNAIDRGRVAHAYLFTGTRGVGKTTMARLFAKAINAPGDKPPEIAEAIMHGRDTDVIEIDGASNRRVEETRELIANCVYRPMRGPFKIYIIDEVHMLTKEAFNTLLKTMEEPPEHVKFILCTTEAVKVPATIQSRCQRFDFRSIPTRQIAGHLGAVCTQEGVKADPGLLMTVARLGQGSMRDALSLLDRLMASGEKALSPRLLEELLGLPDRDAIDALLDAVAGGNPAAALELGEELLRRVSIEQAIESAVERLRDVLALSVCGPETALVELDGEDRARAVAIAGRLDGPAVVHMIALCESVANRAKNSSTPRALFDALLVRLAMTERLADAAALAIHGAPAREAADASPGGPEKKAPAPATHARRPAAAPEPSPAPRAQPAPRPEPLTPTSTPGPGPAPVAAGGPAEEIWRRVRETVTSPRDRTFLGDLRPIEVSPALVRLAAATNEQRAYAQTRTAWLRERLAAVVGGAPAVEVVLDASSGAPAPAPGVTDVHADAIRNPLVRKASELFEARVVRVDPDAPAPEPDTESR